MPPLRLPEAAAEEVGFEPTVGCPTHDFQSCRFGRSRTPPRMQPGQASRDPWAARKGYHDPQNLSCFRRGGRVLRNGRL